MGFYSIFLVIGSFIGLSFLFILVYGRHSTSHFEKAVAGMTLGGSKIYVNDYCAFAVAGKRIVYIENKPDANGKHRAIELAASSITGLEKSKEKAGDNTVYGLKFFILSDKDKLIAYHSTNESEVDELYSEAQAILSAEPNVKKRPSVWGKRQSKAGKSNAGKKAMTTTALVAIPVAAFVSMEVYEDVNYVEPPRKYVAGQMTESDICGAAGLIVKRRLVEGFLTHQQECTVLAREGSEVTVISGYQSPTNAVRMYRAKGYVNGTTLHLREIRVDGVDDEYIPISSFGLGHAYEAGF